LLIFNREVIAINKEGMVQLASAHVIHRSILNFTIQRVCDALDDVRLSKTPENSARVKEYLEQSY